jgi:hypothetical protein
MTVAPSAATWDDLTVDQSAAMRVGKRVAKRAAKKVE